jgi:hypothetical protein
MIIIKLEFCGDESENRRAGLDASVRYPVEPLKLLSRETRGGGDNLKTLS